MSAPKKIIIQHGLIIGETNSLLVLQHTDMNYYSEEHIREVADSLGMSGDAFIAQLNGVSYAEWLKGGNNDR